MVEAVAELVGSRDGETKKVGVAVGQIKGVAVAESFRW
jgi:hypothetical protein